MRNRYLHILLSILLCPAIVHAQQAPDIVVDTVPVMMPPPDEENVSETVVFDSIQVLPSTDIRLVPERVMDSLKALDDFWYFNLERKKKQEPAAADEPKKENMFQAGWFRSLLWIIILGSFIGVVIWYLAASNILIFRRKAKTIAGEETAGEVTDDIFALSYDKEIAAAQAAGNHRLAVRLWYLYMLKELAERKLIDYRFGRTNQHYVSQLSRGPYYRDFFRLTRNFEYTWYGQFDLSAAAYNMMQSDFINFKNSLRQ
jgi:hypothetical protein